MKLLLGTDVLFPIMLCAYGLNEELLTTVFMDNWSKPVWFLKDIPTVEIYQLLYPFLKKWPLSRNTIKSNIGKFYMAIDSNLKKKNFRADNAYRFIERVAHNEPEQ